MNGTTDYKFEKMLDVVQKLLARAEHPGTPDAEADACRARAEAIMFKFKIEQSMLKDGDRHESYNKPVKRTIWVADGDSEFYQQQYDLAWMAFRHSDCEVVYGWASNPEESNRFWLKIDVYGYPGDIRYGEMLFIACRITFMARLEPKVDPSLSDDENIYRLRHAGVERVRIAQMVGWITDHIAYAAKGRYRDAESKKLVDQACTRVTSAVKRACKAKGEDPKPLLGQGNSMKAYRDSFATGYNGTIQARLRRLRHERGHDSAAIVLVKRHEDVKELMYQDHPERRPQPESGSRYTPCEKCAKAKSGHCRQHRPVKFKETKVNSHAFERGIDAGARVDLTGGNSPTGRTSAAPDRQAIN